MAKLTTEQMLDIVEEVQQEMFPEINEENRLPKSISDAILNVLIRFMIKYQDRIEE